MPTQSGREKFARKAIEYFFRQDYPGPLELVLVQNTGQERLLDNIPYGLPYERLMRHTRDPLGDLEAGFYDGLVPAALEYAGVRAGR